MTVVIPPSVAAMLAQFFDEETATNPTGVYTPFDSKLGYWLKDRGVESYIPDRHYGEHGGIPNPEHAKAGLGRPHQADALQGRLVFLPLYTRGSVLRLWKTRSRARVWGWARFLAGRFVDWHDFVRSDRLPMVRFTFGRLLWRKPPRN